MDGLAVWICALKAGYVTGAPWRAWAWRRLEELSVAPPWLVELMDASHASEALHACAIGSGENRDIWSRVDETSLQLGFLWLRHAEGRLGLGELLWQAGSLADRADYAAPDCEAFFWLLNEIDGKGPVAADASPRTLARRAEQLFAPHVERARRAWERTED